MELCTSGAEAPVTVTASTVLPGGLGLAGGTGLTGVAGAGDALGASVCATAAGAPPDRTRASASRHAYELLKRCPSPARPAQARGGASRPDPSFSSLIIRLRVAE